MTAGAASECLRRATHYIAREIEAWLAARKQKFSEDRGSGKLDLLSSLGFGVIDSNLKPWKTHLQLYSTCPGAVPGGKFSFQSAVHFKRVTRSWQLTSGCNHVVPIV